MSTAYYMHWDASCNKEWSETIGEAKAKIEARGYKGLEYLEFLRPNGRAEIRVTSSVGTIGYIMVERGIEVSHSDGQIRVHQYEVKWIDPSGGQRWCERGAVPRWAFDAIDACIEAGKSGGFVRRDEEVYFFGEGGQGNPDDRAEMLRSWPDGVAYLNPFNA